MDLLHCKKWNLIERFGIVCGPQQVHLKVSLLPIFLPNLYFYETIIFVIFSLVSS